ncbi:MAG: carbohydrate kinase family protein [Candidatus Woesebacteria bacterium]
MNEFVSVGYAAIDTIDGEDHFGGAAAGIALNAARLGLKSELISAFGTDHVSILYLQYLEKLGVSTQWSLQSPSFQLPQNHISHDDRTQGWVDFNLTTYLEETSIPTKTLANAHTIHLASAHFSWVEKILQTTHENVSFSPGPKVALDQRYAPLDILSTVPYVFVNEAEWQALQKYYQFTQPSDLIELGAQAIISTQGSQGVHIAYRDGQAIRTQRYQPDVIPNAETTGAGDALALGFLLARMHGVSISAALQFGMQAASEAVRSPGVILPPAAIQNLKKEIQTFL